MAKILCPFTHGIPGESKLMTLDDKIERSELNTIDAPLGSKTDESLKIYPLKVHKEKQIADKNSMKRFLC